MTTHTKGPWHSVEYAGHFNLHLQPFYGEPDLLSMDDYEEADANAKLCAAAPTLLQSLIRLEDYVNRELTVCHKATPNEIKIILGHAREAIKKATE